MILNRFLVIRFAATLKLLQNKHRQAHEQWQKSKLAFYVQSTQAKMEILNRSCFTQSKIGSYILCCPFLSDQTFHGNPRKDAAVFRMYFHRIDQETHLLRSRPWSKETALEYLLIKSRKYYK